MKAYHTNAARYDERVVSIAITNLREVFHRYTFNDNMVALYINRNLDDIPHNQECDWHNCMASWEGLPIEWPIVAYSRHHDDIVSSQLPHLRT